MSIDIADGFRPARPAPHRLPYKEMMMTSKDQLIERVARRMLADMEDHGGVDDFCDKLLGFPEQYLSELAAGAVAVITADAVDKADAWDAVAEKNAALATARNDALEEAAKVAEAAWVSADYETVGVADADMAMRLCEHASAEIRSLKSETKP